MIKKLLFFLLKRQYRFHNEVEMHDYDDCIFCFMNAVEAEKFMKDKK